MAQVRAMYTCNKKFVVLQSTIAQHMVTHIHSSCSCNHLHGTTIGVMALHSVLNYSMEETSLNKHGEVQQTPMHTGPPV